jgi:type IV secretory pathway VirD2 relaxase
MKRDQHFEPKLGKIRQQNIGKSRRVLGQVARAINTAGSKKNSTGNAARFQARRDGKSLIRGAGSGGGARVRKALAGQRRVMIKARIVRIAGRGLGIKTLGAMKAHLNYIQRDGVTRDGDKGQMYGPENDEASAKDFASTCENDRHQFRFIVAPEDAEKLADLKPFVRDLMHEVEKDLGTKLDWVAVDHFNTGHPHSHIVVRGKTDSGDDLVIARDYISHGLRVRAAELMTLELGPKTDVEQVQDWLREVTAERYTGLDLELIRKSDRHQVSLSTAQGNIVERVRGDLLVQRLKQLEAMQLATQTSSRQWSLAPQLETTLRHLGERGDIIKTMHRALKAQQLERDLQSLQIDATDRHKSITGRIIERGLSNENRDLNRAATVLAKDTGMDVEIARNGDEVSGTLLKKLDLVSGRFAVIDQSQSRGLGLTIAPWSSSLNYARGQQISGIMLGSQMRWAMGKDIGIEIL